MENEMMDMMNIIGYITKLYQSLFNYYPDNMMNMMGNPDSPLYDKLTDIDYFDQQFRKLVPVLVNFNPEAEYMVCGEPMDFMCFMRFLLDAEIDWCVDSGKGS